MTERIESVKSGAIAASSLLSAFATLAIANYFLLTQKLKIMATFTDIWQLLLTTASTGISGFLFGVTYRYIIREDRNPHLKSGAVLAFGLVRGLAQLEVGFNSENNWLPIAVQAVESILLFAVAGKVLDAAIARKWVKPFCENSIR